MNNRLDRLQRVETNLSESLELLERCGELDLARELRRSFTKVLDLQDAETLGKDTDAAFEDMLEADVIDGDGKESATW